MRLPERTKVWTSSGPARPFIRVSGLKPMTSLVEFEASEFYSFFNLKETERRRAPDNATILVFKTGAFQEYIDITITLDEMGVIRHGLLILDRDWIGDYRNVNPFGKDVAKSFIGALTPLRDANGVERLASALFSLVGQEDEVYYTGKPPDPVTDQQILSILYCYTGRIAKASISFPGSKVSLTNTQGPDGSRLLVVTTVL